jgi:hypothetical protein
MKSIFAIFTFVALIFISIEGYAQSKGDKSNQLGQSVNPDYTINGYRGSEAFFIDSELLGEIHPAQVKNKIIGKEKADSSKTMVTSSSNPSGIMIVKNSDKNLLNSLAKGLPTPKKNNGATLTPVFRNSSFSPPFVLAGGVEVVFPDSTSESTIQNWLAEQGVHGKAIFTGSKVYTIESGSGWEAMDLANRLSKDPLPESVSPLKFREMSAK